MKEAIKWSIFAAAALLICRIHQEDKRKSGLSWGGYGQRLLGLNQDQEGRREYLDILRFLAAMLVILVHSMGAAAQQPQAARWRYVFTGASGLGLCCNLLFVLISGALLIPYREETLGAFYQKRVQKVVIPMTVYYLFYLHRSGLVSLSLPSIVQALIQILSGPMELVPHFWLIYVLLQLYVGVPLLRFMVRDMPESVLDGIAALILFGMGAKTGLSLLGVLPGLSVPWFSWEGIFFMGYWLTRLPEERYDKRIYLGAWIGGGAILMIQLFLPERAGAVMNDSIFLLLFAMGIFLFFLRRKAPFPGRMLVQLVSRYSFSVLMIHWFMLFVVVEKHLQVDAGSLGGGMAGLAVVLQSLLALFGSLMFAVVFDNTAVLLAERLVQGLFGIWNKGINGRKGRFR